MWGTNSKLRDLQVVRKSHWLPPYRHYVTFVRERPAEVAFLCSEHYETTDFWDRYGNGSSVGARDTWKAWAWYSIGPGRWVNRVRDWWTA
jgi:hypothetical protein